MITCPSCHHREYEGEFFCSECGARIWGVQPESVPTLAFDSAKLRKMTSESFPEVPTVSKLKRGQIALSISGTPQPVILEGRQEFLLGREGHEGRMPDVNLNPYGGREKGVSRIHASLRIDRQQLLLMDLGSSNGTQLNGTQIAAHEPMRLENGDEIRLGKLSIRVNFSL